MEQYLKYEVRLSPGAGRVLVITSFQLIAPVAAAGDISPG